jgi:hypothetical protein
MTVTFAMLPAMLTAALMPSAVQHRCHTSISQGVRGAGVAVTGARSQRHPFPVANAAAADPQAAGKKVAEWCMTCGREEATIAVSSATTIAGVLRDFWAVAHAFAMEPGPRGRQRVIAMPSWQEGNEDLKLFEKLLSHINDCTDVCEYVGDSMMIAGRHPAAKSSSDDEPQSAPCAMVVLKSFLQREWKDYSAENFGEADPFEKLGAEADAEMNKRAGADGWPDDAEVLASTRSWVEGVIVEMKVCPFAGTADTAGLPSGGVTYPLSHATTGEEVYEAFWAQVLELAA